MLSINDLKVGTKVNFNGQPYVVIFSEHSKLGRGGGIQRTKMRNLISAAIIEKTFSGAEKLEEAELETKKAQYLYKDDNGYNFMDSATFEQFSLAKNQLGKTAGFLKEGGEVDILYFEEEPININLPIKMTFEITYTEPGFKGNTASTVNKPATIETGSQVMVPLFIKNGDKIVLDTRTGEYVERANN
ncbi:MAG: elongation factor elongation factor [Candidatus Berkelbacteria bacterium]|nr:elongation factor elongation factor [Candidatus Berkelbacteria bacterium]